MDKQTKANIQYDLDFARVRLGNIVENGSLATKQNIEELVEAIRHVNAAVQQVIDAE